MINYIIINGTNSNTINGLGINELPPISKPPLRVQTEEIDGRDGDISTNLGYGAYDKTISIGLFGTGYDINEVISFFNGEGTVVFSNEPDKYYKYKIINQIDYEALLKFKSASITFHCQPFKYPLEETPLEIEYEYIEQEGVESATMNNTNGGTSLKIDLKGNTSQTGTPTPDTPIPINVVSGDNTIEVEGRNLAYTSWASDFVSRINNSSLASLTTKDGKNCVKFDRTAGYGDYDNKYLFKTHWEENTQYTITCSLFAEGNNAMANIGVVYTDGTTSDNRYSRTIDNWHNFYLTSDENKTIKYIRVSYLAGTNYIDLDTFMVCIGTSQLPYEPYQSQTYPINLGTLELCKIGDYQDYFTKNSGKNKFDGTYVNAYTAAASPYTFSSSSNSRSGIVKVEPNTTYTISKEASNRFRIGEYSSQPEIGVSTATNFISTDGTTTYTLTTGNTTNYLAIQVTTESQENVKMQVELGTQGTLIEPYGTGKWCKYNVIGKEVLNGSESDDLSITYTSSTRTSIKLSNVPNAYGNDNQAIYDIYSNRFTKNRQAIIYGAQAVGVAILGSAKAIYFCIEQVFPNVSAVETWFSNNNTEVLYPLATPYLSLIENETLISQLDNIQNAMSYEGTTNISQVNNDKPFLLDLIAMKKGTDEVVINNIGNVYAKPTIALEGTGETDIYLNNTEILKVDLSEKNKITIDTNNMEAYDPTDNSLANRKVIGNYNSMTLPSGNTTMKITGALTKATISNYTRWL